MRYQKYLNERDYTISNIETEEIINQLHIDCSDYFKYIKYGVKSFRGTKKKYRNIYTKIKPRKNRIPSGLPEVIHDELGLQLKKKFGWNPRTEGVFATGDFIQSQEFGDPCYFYPSNGFKMIWSDIINDIYVNIKSDGFLSFTQPDESINSYIEQLIKDYKSGTAKDINKALQSFNEVMFQCKFYYMVNINFVTQNFDRIYK